MYTGSDSQVWGQRNAKSFPYPIYTASAWRLSVMSALNERTWAGQGSTCVCRQSSSRRAKAESMVALSARQLSKEICDVPASSSAALSPSADHRLFTHWHEIQDLVCLWVAEKNSAAHQKASCTAWGKVWAAERGGTAGGTGGWGGKWVRERGTVYEIKRKWERMYYVCTRETYWGNKKWEKEVGESKEFNPD